MIDITTVFLGVLQIVVQLVAVFFAYRLTKITGIFRAWMLIILALVLMTARRFTALVIQLGSLPAETGTISFIDQIVLPSIISIILVLAMYDLLRTFSQQFGSKHEGSAR
jgi:cell shape-determining protein MreD